MLCSRLSKVKRYLMIMINPSIPAKVWVYKSTNNKISFQLVTKDTVLTTAYRQLFSKQRPRPPADDRASQHQGTDSKLLADGNAVYRYSEEGQEVLASFFGHTGTVQTGGFLEGHLLTGSSDSTVRLFNLDTGEQLYSQSLTTNKYISIIYPHVCSSADLDCSHD